MRKATIAAGGGGDRPRTRIRRYPSASAALDVSRMLAPPHTITAPATETSTQAATACFRVHVNKNSRLRVRKSPSLKAAIVGFLNSG
jgi:hypothetical protein